MGPFDYSKPPKGYGDIKLVKKEKHTFPVGHYYTGEWTESFDYFEGKGILVQNNGVYMEGFFKKNIRHGPARTI
jgi:hypothetical protein